jgi:hypothetical protein
LKARSLLVLADPVDAESLRLSKQGFDELLKTRHDKIRAEESVCSLIVSDEAKSVRCRVRIDKRLLALRSRSDAVKALFDCGSVADVALRASCVKKVAKKIRSARPRTSAACKRRVCRKSFGKFKKVVKSSARATAADASQQITAALAKLSDKKAKLALRREKCRRLTNSARRARCSRKVRARLAALRSRERVFRRLEECGAHIDPKRRKRCLRAAVHQARKSNKCPHSRKSCKSKTRLRKEYRSFLRGFKAAVGVISKSSASTDAINAAVEGLAATLAAQTNAQAARKDVCAKLKKRKAKRSCFRDHRRSRRALRRRQRAVNRLRRCGRHTDSSKRRQCGRSLARRARKATPKSCKHSKNSCRSQNRTRAHHVQFVKQLKALKKSIGSSTEFEVLSKRFASKLDTRLNRLRLRCRSASNSRKQRRCARALTRLEAFNKRCVKAVASLQRCQDFVDSKSRRKCARKLIAKAAKKVPKECHRNVCARKNRRLRRFVKFEESLKAISKLVSAATVSVHDVNKAAAELSSRLSSRRPRKCRGSDSRACKRTLTKLARRTRRLTSLVSRLQKCASVSDVKLRSKCARRVVSRARKAQPRGCRKNVCKLKNKARKEFVRFIAGLNAIVKVSNAGTATSIDVAAAATELTERNKELGVRIAQRRARCKKITSRARRGRCLNRVRRAAKNLTIRRRLLKNVMGCGKRTDVRSRKRCNKRVLRSARRNTPRLCVVSLSKQKKHRKQIRKVHHSARRRAKRAVRVLGDLAASITRADFSVTSFDKAVGEVVRKLNVRLAKLKLQKADCTRLTGRRRAVCLRRVRSQRRVVRSALRNIRSLVACRKRTDPKKCIASLLRRSRRAIPAKEMTRKQCRRISRRIRGAKRVLRLTKKGNAKKLDKLVRKRHGRITRRESRCRRIESKRRQRKCLKRVTVARDRLAALTRHSAHVARCQEHIDQVKRKRCQKRAVRKARRAVPKPCPVGRRKCNRRQKARGSYQRFLTGLNAIIRGVSSTVLNSKIVAAAVSDSVRRNRKGRRALARSLARCRRSIRCRRRVHKQQKALAKRRQVVRVAAACGSQATLETRRKCSFKVLRKAARKMPQGCRANRSRRIKAQRRQFFRFLRGARRLAALVTATPATTKSDLEKGLESRKRSVAHSIKRLRRRLSRCNNNSRCLSLVRKQLRRLKGELRMYDQLVACNANIKEKAKCVGRILRLARRRNPRPPRSRSSCNKQKRLRKRYASFVAEFNALVDVISAPGEVNSANQTAATATLSSRFDRTDSRIQKKQSKCSQLKLKRRIRCHRAVRRARRVLAHRKSLVDRVSLCVKETDDSKKFQCTRIVRRKVMKGFPRRCRRSTNCAKKGLAIATFLRMEGRVQTVAGNLTLVDAALTSVSARYNAHIEKERVCKAKQSRRKRRTCVRAHKRALKLVTIEQNALNGIKV